MSSEFCLRIFPLFAAACLWLASQTRIDPDAPWPHIVVRSNDDYSFPYQYANGRRVDDFVDAMTFEDIHTWMDTMHSDCRVHDPQMVFDSAMECVRFIDHDEYKDASEKERYIDMMKKHFKIIALDPEYIGKFQKIVLVLKLANAEMALNSLCVGIYH